MSEDAAALKAHLETLKLGLAHELRTPLAVLRAKAELLPMAGELNERQTGLVGDMVAAVERAEALIESLLTGTTAGSTGVPL